MAKCKDDLLQDDDFLEIPGMPTSMESFDYRILPPLLLGSTIAFSLASILFIAYQVICNVVIFSIATNNKRFWRSIAVQVDFNNDSSKNQAVHYKPGILSSILGFSVKRDIAQTVGKEKLTKEDKRVVDNTRLVLDYLTNQCPERHQCRFCLIDYEINKPAYIWSLISQLGTLLTHSFCLVASVRNDLQILFYSLGLLFILIDCLPLLFMDGVSKILHIPSLFRSEQLCGYQRTIRFNEVVSISLSTITFVLFVAMFIIYFLRDDFIRSFFWDFNSSM